MDHLPLRLGIAIASMAGLSACFDFGYAVPPPPDVSDPDGPAAPNPDGGVSVDGPSPDVTTCVEGTTDPSDTGPQISLITLNVDKPMINVKTGDTVTWTNTDSMRHTVTAGAPGAILPPEQGGFDSGELAPGTKWAYRFCVPRQVVYFCTTHPNQMNNYRILVEE